MGFHAIPSPSHLWRVEQCKFQADDYGDILSIHLSTADEWDGNPDWVTLGLFETREEAEQKMREMRAMRGGDE